MFRIIFIICYAALLLATQDLSYIEKATLFIPTLAIMFSIDHYLIHKVEFYTILTTGIILVITFTLVYLLSQILLHENSIFAIEQEWNEIIIATLTVISFYFSIRIGFYSEYFKKKKDSNVNEVHYLVDTCAIIDGRLLEVAKSGFIPKNLIIPNFVIQELQLISDSYSHEKRSKGRRGLDLLKHMKNSDHLSIQIINEDIEDIKTVDAKLLALAKKYDYKIITTDFNLAKVAQLQGVQCLNINFLATLIKPAINIGDRIRVQIIKKGSNKDQGLAFLPDDTMVVIEEGEKFIGNQKQVLITSFIQSESGKMAFAKLSN